MNDIRPDKREGHFMFTPWTTGYPLNMIYGETSYREKRLTLAERGRNRRFRNKW